LWLLVVRTFPSSFLGDKNLVAVLQPRGKANCSEIKLSCDLRCRKQVEELCGVHVFIGI
jgi:hypothetical protein